MTRPDRSASTWARIAGVLLILDGLFVLLIGSVVFTVFRPVAAIEGRPSPDQAPWPVLVVTVLLALACFWAGQRAIRGIRARSGVGVALAILLAAPFGLVLLNTSASLPELVFALSVVAIQVVIIVGLVRRPAAATVAPEAAAHGQG